MSILWFVIAAIVFLVIVARRRRRRADALSRRAAFVSTTYSRPPATPASTRELTARTILFIDVETTGLSGEDRIVTLGAIKLRLDAPGDIVWLHLVFNPERRCSRRAEELHGWDGRTLKRQDLFAPFAAPLRAWCDEADLVVAHNAAFDLRFVNGTFLRSGVTSLSAPSECTMLAARARGFAAGLDAVCARMGVSPRDRHSAIEDAWRCMQVFLWLRGLPWRIDSPGLDAPANYRAAPPKRPRGRPRKTAEGAVNTPEG